MVKKAWLRETGETVIITFFGIAMTAATALIARWLATPLVIIIWLIMAFIALLLWNRFKKRGVTMAEKSPFNKRVAIDIEDANHNLVIGNHIEGFDQGFRVKNSHGNTINENTIISPRNNQQQEPDDENHHPGK